MLSLNHETPLTLLYVTFDLGDNVGGILDYLVASFEHVYFLSLRMHDYPEHSHNSLFVWKNGEKTVEKSLPTLIASSRFLVPFINALNAIELAVVVNRIRREMPGTRIMLFTPNSFYAAVGLVLRPLMASFRVVLWVTDIILPRHSDKQPLGRALYRWAARWIGPWVFRKADAVWFMTDLMRQIIMDRMPPSYKPRSEVTASLAIGEHPYLDTTRREAPRVGFTGNIAHHKGASMLIEIIPRLLEARPDVQIEVIGGGSGLEDLLHLQPQIGANALTLYGIISDQAQLAQIMNRWQVALAPFPPPPPEEYFGGMSKVHIYLSLHLPTVLTRLPWLPEEIHEAGAGVAVDFEVDAFVQGTLTVLDDPVAFRQRAAQFATCYSPSKLYGPAFEALIGYCYPDQE